MDDIFMNSAVVKISNPNILNLSIKINLKRSDKYVALWNFHGMTSVQIWSYFWSEYRKKKTRKNSVFGHFSRSNIYHEWKNIKKYRKTLNLKHQLRHGMKILNYLMNHILYQIFKVIGKVLSKSIKKCLIILQ